MTDRTLADPYQRPFSSGPHGPSFQGWLSTGSLATSSSAARAMTAPVELPDTVEKAKTCRLKSRSEPCEARVLSTISPNTLTVKNAARLAPPRPATMIGVGEAEGALAQLFASFQRSTAAANVICRLSLRACSSAWFVFLGSRRRTSWKRGENVVMRARMKARVSNKGARSLCDQAAT